MSTLRLVHHALFLTHACWKSNNTNARLMVFALSLALDPTVGKHDGNLSHGKFSYSFFVRSFSEPTISQISSGITELSSRLDDCIAKLSIQNCLQTRHWPVNPKINYYCQLRHASSFENKATTMGGCGVGERNYTSAGDFNNYFEAVELVARQKEDWL